MINHRQRMTEVQNITVLLKNQGKQQQSLHGV